MTFRYLWKVLVKQVHVEEQTFRLFEYGLCSNCCTWRMKIHALSLISCLLLIAYDLHIKSIFALYLILRQLTMLFYCNLGSLPSFAQTVLNLGHFLYSILHLNTLGVLHSYFPLLFRWIFMFFLRRRMTHNNSQWLPGPLSQILFLSSFSILLFRLSASTNLVLELFRYLFFHLETVVRTFGLVTNPDHFNVCRRSSYQIGPITINWPKLYRIFDSQSSITFN